MWVFGIGSYFHAHLAFQHLYPPKTDGVKSQQCPFTRPGGVEMFPHPAVKVDAHNLRPTYTVYFPKPGTTL